MAGGEPRQRAVVLTRRRWAMVAASAAVLLAVAYGGLYEVRRVTEERIHLPGTGPRLSVAQISDVDFGGAGTRERRVAALLQTEPPDLLVVTGDLVEFRGGRGSRYLEAAVAFLDGLPARRGILYVLGESERHHLRRLQEAVRGTRVRLLVNEELEIEVEGRTVSVFGFAMHQARFEAARLGGGPAVRGRSAGLFSPLVDDTPGAASWRDYEMTGTLRFDDPEDYVGVIGYARGDAADAGYALLRHQDRRRFHLRRLGPGGPLLAGSPLGGPVPRPADLVRYRLRVQSFPDANRIQGKLWPAGQPEPAAWQVDGEDRAPDRPRSGPVGIVVKGGGDDRWFGPWEVRSLADGEILGRRRLEGFDLRDGTWRYRSALRAWAPPEEPARAFRLLLAHNPDVVLDLEGLGAGPVDLILSGHTQGGQVRLPLVGALYTGTELGTRYAAGLFKRSGRWLYINRGLGTSWIPFRFLCPPELTRLEVPLGPPEPAGLDAHAPR